MDLRHVDVNRLLAETSERLGEQGTHHERCVSVEVLADGAIASYWRGPGGGFATRCEADHLPMRGDAAKDCAEGDKVMVDAGECGRGERPATVTGTVLAVDGERLHVDFDDGADWPNNRQWITRPAVIAVLERAEPRVAAMNSDYLRAVAEQDRDVTKLRDIILQTHPDDVLQFVHWLESDDHAESMAWLADNPREWLWLIKMAAAIGLRSMALTRAEIEDHHEDSDD